MEVPRDTHKCPAPNKVYKEIPKVPRFIPSSKHMSWPLSTENKYNF